MREEFRGRRCLAHVRWGFSLKSRWKFPNKMFCRRTPNRLTCINLHHTGFNSFSSSTGLPHASNQDDIHAPRLHPLDCATSYDTRWGPTESEVRHGPNATLPPALNGVAPPPTPGPSPSSTPASYRESSPHVIATHSIQDFLFGLRLFHTGSRRLDFCLASLVSFSPRH